MTVVLMLLIWAGVMSALFAGISTDIRNRDYLQGRAQTIADSLSAAQIRNLNGNSNDLTSLSYNEVKSRLQQIKAGNQDIDTVYLLGRNSSNVIHYADSNSPDQPGYSAPGQINQTASARLKSAFTTSTAFIEGPSRSQEGILLTAYAPVIDQKNRETIALIGVSTSATAYYAQILLFALVPLLLVAIPFAGLLRDIKIQSKEHEIFQLKNQFVSIASHEIRSPLNGMLWAIQSLMRGGTAKMTMDQQELLSDMYRSTESSLTTVNEILDLSIFERGESKKLQSDLVDVGAVLNQVIQTLKLGASEKHIIISKKGAWPSDAYVRADVGALKRAMMNILSNAIKYSDSDDKINVSYRSTETEHIIAFSDHGIGIPEAEQQKVLGGYYRATNAGSKSASGTGLGLWVTRMIIEQHSGRLWLNSKLGEGTTISVALPLAKKPAQKII